MYIFLYKTRYLWRTCHNTPISRLAVAPKVTAAEAPRTYLDVCRVCSKDGRAAGYRTSPSGSTPILRLHDFTCFSTPSPRPPHRRSTLVLLRSGAAALPHLCTKVRQNLQLYSGAPSICACRKWGKRVEGRLHSHRHPVGALTVHRLFGPGARRSSRRADCSFKLLLLLFSNLGADACSLVWFYV